MQNPHLILQWVCRCSDDAAPLVVASWQSRWHLRRWLSSRFQEAVPGWAVSKEMPPVACNLFRCSINNGRTWGLLKKSCLWECGTGSNPWQLTHAGCSWAGWYFRLRSIPTSWKRWRTRLTDVEGEGFVVERPAIDSRAEMRLRYTAEEFIKSLFFQPASLNSFSACLSLPLRCKISACAFAASASAFGDAPCVKRQVLDMYGTVYTTSARHR